MKWFLGLSLLGLILFVGLVGLQIKRLESNMAQKIKNEYAKQPLAPDQPLTAKDLEPLPQSVKNYLRYSGAIGQPKLRTMRLEMRAEMFRTPNSPGMISEIRQVTFFNDPARYFFLSARMFGLPVNALHVYTQKQATFKVKLLGIFNLVDSSGEALSKTETVTVLNDMCLIAPASLVDSRLSWKETGPLSAAVTFTNGPYQMIYYF